MIKRIVCLANSRKLSGRCVAGREFGDGVAGPWIRPISSREHQEVSWYERSYESAADPKLLDIIDIPLIEHRPYQYQSENWLLDGSFYWRKVGEADWAALSALADSGRPLWENGISSYHGINDRIALLAASSEQDSLRLVHTEQLQIRTFRPGEAFNNPKRRVQGRFRLGKDEYALWITDPMQEHRYLALPDGTHELGECFLTISLGEPLDGHVYKLIAGVIERVHADK